MTFFSPVYLNTLASNSSQTITGGQGFTKISIKNNASSGFVTITGSLGSGNGVTLAAGQEWTWVSQPSAYSLDGIVITTDGSATAQVSAS